MSNPTRFSRQRVIVGAPEASTEFRDFGIYGLRVRSPIDLGEWPPPPAGDPQVTIIVDPPSEPTFAGDPHSAKARYSETEFHLEVRDVARYAAIGGTCLRVAPEPGAKREDVRHYLTGAMFGAILHQRRVYALHASCVLINGSAVAFAAPSGSGKSTLNAALLRRGATFVSDDICALTPGSSGGFNVWPSAPRLKLDRASVTEFDDPAAAFDLAGGSLGKYHVPLTRQARQTTAVPLSRVYLLSFGDGPARLERLSGLEAISALLDETYILLYAAAMGLSPQIFKTVAELVQTVTVSRLIRPRGFEHFDTVLNLIECDAGADGRAVSSGS